MTDLPRLAVISDVAPVRTQGGELLLYRLLADYPAEKLAVVHANRSPYFDETKLLPGVDYHAVEYNDYLPARLHTRWFPIWPAVELAAARRHAPAVASRLKRFDPEVVLTVTDYKLWVAAASVAEASGIPLVIIQHDDLVIKSAGNSQKPHHRLTRRLMNRTVGRVYRQARARFCVSPGMAELYAKRYGGRAEVLYPSRGDDSPEPRVRVRDDWHGPPVVAFAGALYTEGARELLRQMATLLEGLGGELHLYGKDDRAGLARYNLDRPNVTPQGFLPPKEMADRMAETAHVLFLPASFRDDERVFVSTLFPSKLADYTAVGLPVLVWGPGHSSAVRWARENAECCQLSTSEDTAEVTEILSSLLKDRSKAAGIARAGVLVGTEVFSDTMARKNFWISLNNSRSNNCV